MLSVAKDFRIVQKEVSELLKDRILVGHALRNDLKVSMQIPVLKAINMLLNMIANKYI